MTSVQQLLDRAMQCYRAGNLQQAEQLYREILQVDPHHVDALHLLGVVNRQLGRKNLAHKYITEALKLKPDFAEAISNLANVLKDDGKLEEAITHYHEALRLKPGMADAHSNLGAALLEQGKLDEAVASLQQALRLNPAHANAHSSLGTALKDQGKLDEAVASLRQAVRLNPAHADAHSNLGAVRLEQGKLDDAVASLEQALRINPTHANAHSNLGAVLLEQGKVDEAVASLQHALRFNPGHVPARASLGNALRMQGKLEQAADSFIEALRVEPDCGEALVGLGKLHEEQGELAEAEAAYRHALRVQPSQCQAHASLATLLRGKLPEADVAMLQQRLADSQLTKVQRSQLLFCLAHVLDARANFNRAADCLQEANALRRELAVRKKREYVPEIEQSFFDGVLRQFGPDFFARTAGGGLDTEGPVFVFGLPRSGTTLVEQILASNSRVHGAGELVLAGGSFDSIPAVLGRCGEPLACVPLLGVGAIRSLAEGHLARLLALAPLRIGRAAVERIVDKMPANYAYVGLVAAMFPRAVFIHCSRDLRDVAVSCWMQDFLDVRWANDPMHIAWHFRQYRRLMDHWRAVLPVPIHEVQYEELVEDLEGVSRRLVAACRLEWEPACLEFHRTKRQVRTASVTQVRQPIYKKSVGRWKNYEKTLADLFAALPQE